MSPRNATGFSDPITFVSVNGQEQFTEVHKETSSCVWDHLMFFECDLTREEFNELKVKINVKDQGDLLAGDTLIGTTTSSSNKFKDIFRETYPSAPYTSPSRLSPRLAGLYELDAAYVYKQPGHEVHRRWVGLMNPENPEDAGKGGCTVGYLTNHLHPDLHRWNGVWRAAVGDGQNYECPHDRMQRCQLVRGLKITYPCRR